MLLRCLAITFLLAITCCKTTVAQQVAIPDSTAKKPAYTKEDIDNLVKNNKILFLEFTAVWCGPCKKMAPIIDEIERENGGKIKVVRVDYDINRQLAKNMNIYEIPYTQIYYDGKLLENIIGIMEKKVLLEQLPKGSL